MATDLSRLSRLYIQVDLSIFVMGAAAMRRYIAAGDPFEWIAFSTEMKAQCDPHTGVWSSLPPSLMQWDDGALGVVAVRCALFTIDDSDEIFAASGA